METVALPVKSETTTGQKALPVNHYFFWLGEFAAKSQKHIKLFL